MDINELLKLFRIYKNQQPDPTLVSFEMFSDGSGNIRSGYCGDERVLFRFKTVQQFADYLKKETDTRADRIIEHFVKADLVVIKRSGDSCWSVVSEILRPSETATGCFELVWLNGDRWVNISRKEIEDALVSYHEMSVQLSGSNYLIKSYSSNPIPN
jgi:hypothetical protein